MDKKYTFNEDWESGHYYLEQHIFQFNDIDTKTREDRQLVKTSRDTWEQWNCAAASLSIVLRHSSPDISNQHFQIFQTRIYTYKHLNYTNVTRIAHRCTQNTKQYLQSYTQNSKHFTHLTQSLSKTLERAPSRFETKEHCS